MMESAGEKAEVPVQSTAAPSEAEKPAENIDPEPQPTTADPSAGVKVRHIFTYHIVCPGILLIHLLTTRTCIFLYFHMNYFSLRHCFRMVGSMMMSYVSKPEISSL